MSLGRVSPAPSQTSLRARFAALRNIWPFLILVWQASPALMLISMLLRLVRAMLPVAALWIGKLIIDELVRLSARIGLWGKKAT